MKSLIKKKFPIIYSKLSFVYGVGLPRLSINFIFQRIFRINSRIPASVCYSSSIIGADLVFNSDRNTLTSFAVSGGIYIQSSNGVTLGKNILIAPGVKIISANHAQNKVRSHVCAERVIIGDNVWIGANAIILPGVRIADNCTVGAGAVVTKSANKMGSVLVGNPAHPIGEDT